MAKKAARQIVVKQDEKAPIATEVIASSIQAISEGMKALRSGRLNDRAIVLLVHAATKPVSPYKQKASQQDVRCVLEGIESLADQFLR